MAKIIFLNRFFSPDLSATSQMVSDLAFDLAGQGYNISVITSRMRYDQPLVKLPAIEEVKGVHIHRTATTRYGRMGLAGRSLDYLSFYFSAAFKLARLVNAGDVVVVKTDPPLINVVANLIVRWRGALQINWLQDLFPEIAEQSGFRLAKPPVGPLLSALRNYSLRHSAHNVVIGELMRNALVREGVDKSCIGIIENWADGKLIQPVPMSENPLRKEWNLSESFVVAYSGNLGRAHEWRVIVSAAEQLAARSDIVFLFIGGGVQWQPLAEEVKRRKLGNVVFQPYQSRAQLRESLGVGNVHLVSLKQQMEGFIVPSKFYGIAAAGRPTIFIGQTDGELAKLITQGQVGNAVSPSDVEGLTAAITHFADQPQLCEAAGVRARSLFEANWSRTQGVAKWGKLLSTYLP